MSTREDKTSRFAHFGFFGLKLKCRVQSVYAIAAAPWQTRVPGFRICTPSADKNRIVLIARAEKSLFSTMMSLIFLIKLTRLILPRVFILDSDKGE